MRRRQDEGWRLLARGGLPVLALALLASSPLWGFGAPPDGEAGLGRVALLALLALLASLHAPGGRGGLGLGAAVLPTVLVYSGAAIAGWLAALVHLLRELVWRWLPPDVGPRRRLPLTRGLRAGAHVVLAAIAAAGVYGLLGGLAAADGAGTLTRLAAAGAVYLGLLGAARLADPGGERPGDDRERLPPLALDAGGWAAGLLTAALVAAMGWTAALLSLVVTAALALEAARNAALRRLALGRARQLRELTLAGHRIIFRNPDLAGIAEQIHTECRQVLPYAWFQFELLRGQFEGRSWHAGPDGRVREGAPAPPAVPPPLPGIHRRAAWRLVGRELATREETLARMTFWCDPRKLQPVALDLLDSLLPQMASAVHRALLDREARRDPLTDLPDRRALESQLERAFADCLESGSPMAIIMCDLDRFKRINDRIGHAAGDAALIEVARLLEDHRRDTDLCCRYGGEEFAVVLERSDGATALRVAERLRRAVEQLVFTAGGRQVSLRVSAGVAAFPELPVRNPEDLLHLADEALLEAKRRGRNRCLLHLGGRRFVDPEGGHEDDGEPRKEIEPPTLFA